jgi:antitoxin (DNA-binding transcriptional repressor) of toxin-antitoxin stability system
MTTYAVSVTEFKAHCLDVIRQVETTGTPVDLLRRNKVVARLVPMTATVQGQPMWLRLRGQGVLLSAPEDSVLAESDFDAASDHLK